VSNPFDEDEDDEYFAEYDPDAELTGLEPKFVGIEGMHKERGVITDHNELGQAKTDDLIALYIKTRNQLATDTKGYKARRESIKTFQQVISMILRDRGDQNGVDSFATASGTAYRNKKEKFPIADWEQLVGYIKSTGNFHLLQKRLSPNAVKDIREAEGALPTGVGVIEEVEFSVRSPAKKRK
jgi:hypothetical protein